MSFYFILNTIVNQIKIQFQYLNIQILLEIKLIYINVN